MGFVWTTPPTVAIFGDSIIGVDADDKGGLVPALRDQYQSMGLEVIDVTGVQGSRAGDWMWTKDGHTPHRTRHGGRMAGKGRPLSAAQKRKADLDRIAALKADVYHINLVTNDIHAGQSPTTFADNAMDIIGALPKRALIVWTEGNDEPDKNASKRAALSELRRRAVRAYGPRVLVIDNSEFRLRRHYVGKGLHPSFGAHRAFINEVAPELSEHIGQLAPKGFWGAARDVVAPTAVMLALTYLIHRLRRQ